jgi:hypothetical protein
MVAQQEGAPPEPVITKRKFIFLMNDIERLQGALGHIRTALLAAVRRPEGAWITSRKSFGDPQRISEMIATA